MKKVCFFDTKPYDKVYFDQLKADFGIEIDYFEAKLDKKTAVLSKGYDAVIAFVNDEINKTVIDILVEFQIKIIALRSAGFNNVDLKAAQNKIRIVRVPEYSPYAVAEYTMALLLTLNRKTHKAYNRVREFNFSLNNLSGFDLYGKTAGIIGTGKIGCRFIEICIGFGMNVLAYDPYPKEIKGVTYCTLDELIKQSDIISLHCPLTKDTYHIINNDTIDLMKKDTILLNTSRGALINSEHLLFALRNGRISGAALDVYEEESDLFFEDHSFEVIKDEVLTQLVTLPNVLITSHQGFLTKEALFNIAKTTFNNLKEFFDDGGADKNLTNEVCYKCQN